MKYDRLIINGFRVFEIHERVSKDKDVEQKNRPELIHAMSKLFHSLSCNWHASVSVS